MNERLKTTLLAPNGRPSNLSSEDWRLVRSHEFKAWAGDWESSDRSGGPGVVLDENGEPLAVWHGSNRTFDRFDISKGGDNTGHGTWTDLRTGEKVSADSERAAFFTSERDVAVSYVLLAKHYENHRVYHDLYSLYPCFHAMTNYNFKDRESFVSTIERMADLVPELSGVLASVKESPSRKIMSDIIPSIPEKEREGIAERILERRREYSDRLKQMDHGQLANMFRTYGAQRRFIETLNGNMDRLRHNDLTVPNEHGTFENYNAAVYGDGDRALYILVDDGRLMFRGRGLIFYLDEASDEDILKMTGLMEEYNGALGREIDGEVEKYGFDEGASLYRCFVKMSDPLVHDYGGSSFPDKYKDSKYDSGYVAARQVRKAVSGGNDGVVYKNIRDPFLSDTYGVFDPDRIFIAERVGSIRIAAQGQGTKTGIEADKTPDMQTRITITHHEGPWTREEVLGSRGRLFLFTDNTDRDSGGGVVDRESGYYRTYGDGVHDLHYPSRTSAVIRGLPNAMPVSTQRWYHIGAKGEAGRWQDDDADLFEATVSKEFYDIRRRILAGYGEIDTVVLPGNDGFFGSRISAITQERTPELYRILQGEEYGLDRFVESLNRMNDGISARMVDVPEGLLLRRGGPEFTGTIRSIVKGFLEDGYAYYKYEGEDYNFAGLLSRFPDAVRKAAKELEEEEHMNNIKQNNVMEKNGDTVGVPSPGLLDVEQIRRRAEEIKAAHPPVEDLTIASRATADRSSTAAVLRYAEEHGGVPMVRASWNGMHYGNPFSFNRFPGVQVIVSDTREAVEAFRDWLAGKAYTDIEPERREWIVSNILSGGLIGKELVYYTSRIPSPNGYEGEVFYSMDKAPNHAHVILEYVNHPERLAEAINSVRVAAAPAERQNHLPSAAPTPSVGMEAWLGSLPAFSLAKLLAEFPFPDEGEDAAMDAAFDAVRNAMSPGWTDGLDEGEIKAKLEGVFRSFSPDVQDALRSASAEMDLGMTDMDSYRFDVWTLGTSNRPEAELMGLVPAGVTEVVDIRNYPYNSRNRHLNKGALEAEFRRRGIRYTHLKGLSGKAPGGAVAGEKDVYDYSKVAQTEEFKADYRRLQEKVASGGKVLVISSEGSPEYSQRALLVGQQLLRDGLTAGHISTDRSGRVEVLSQDQLVRRRLGSNRIAEGSAKDIFFRSDGKWEAGEGARVVKDAESAEGRLIPGNWNYGRPVDIIEDDSESYRSGYRKLAEWADFTVVFSTSDTSVNDRNALKAAGRDGLRIHVPDDPDMVKDPETARRMASRISDRLSRNLLYHFNQDPSSIDLENVKLHIVGSDIARISVKPVMAKVTEEELSGVVKETFRKTGGAEAGFKLDDQTGVTQEDINILMKNVLKELMSVRRNIEFEDASGHYENPFHITEVRTNGQTGIAEGAVVAAQSLGVKTGILAPKEWRHIIDNETLTGREVHDKAMFINRFHLGERNAITAEEIQEKVDVSIRESRSRELDLAPGLSDFQILMMSFLGFSNTAIIDAVELADEHGVVIAAERVTGKDGEVRNSYVTDMMDFVDILQGYGIRSDKYISEESILAAEEKVREIVEADRARGIGYITIGSPLYPEQLRDFGGFRYMKESQDYRHDVEAGVASAWNETEDVREQRPAILRFKGDPRALGLPSVAVVGARRSPDSAKQAARMVGRALQQGGVAVVASLQPAAVVEHSTVTYDFVGDAGTAGERPELRKVYAHEDSQSAAVNEAVRSGGQAVVFSPNALDYHEDREQIDRIVAAGGIVLSEMASGAGTGHDEQRMRADRMSVAFGGVSVLLDGEAQSELETARAASLGRYVVAYPGAEGVHAGLSANEEALRDGFVPVAVSGAGLDDLVETARSRSKDAVAESLMEENARIAEEARAVDQHPGQWQFYVVRRGTEQVFVVPARYPDVRDAVMKAYGGDVRFADDVQETRKALSSRRMTVDGEDVALFDGYSGTELQQEPVYMTPLYYRDGQIHSQLTAPPDTPNLAPLNVRIEHRRLFEEFKVKAADIQRRFQEAAGFPGAAPVRFENAMYPVISPNSVDIYEGDVLRGRVFITFAGSIRIQNHDRLSDDLGEHSQRKDPFFLNPGGFVDKVGMDYAAIIMEMRLMGTSIEECDMYATADREALAEIREKIEQGWEKPSVDNIDLASSDINRGEEAGLLAKPDGEEIDRKEVLKSLMKQSAQTHKAMKEMVKKEAAIAREYGQLMAQRDAAYDSGQDPASYKDIDEKLVTLGEDRLAAIDRITSLRTEYGRLSALMRTVATADRITVSSDDPKGRVVSVAGQAVRLSSGKFAKAVEEEAGPLLEKLEAEVRKESEDFRAAVSRVEEKDMGADAIARRFDTKKAAPEGYALKEEIKAGTGLSNGMYVICRDGKEAYADENLRIVSRFYQTAYPFRSKWGLVYDGEGRLNYVRPDGSEIMQSFVDAIEPRSEGFSVVRLNGLYNHVDASGRFLCEDWSGNARDFHDGWAVIQGGPADGDDRGRFNFVNARGEVMFAEWLDNAGDFVDGKAVVTRGGENRLIDTGGNDLGPFHDELRKGRGIV